MSDSEISIQSMNQEETTSDDNQLIVKSEDINVGEELANVEYEEELTNEENFRFTVKPINPRYEVFWKLYKQQQDSYCRQLMI